MKSFIYHLRGKSEEQKRRILYALTLSCGVILVFLWLYSLGTNFTDTDTQAQIEEDLKPLSVLKDNLALPPW